MRWKALRPGDRVNIIAPASYSPHEKLEEGVEWLRSLDLEPFVPKNLITPDLFFASSLETQLTHLTEAINGDAKAIWCLRGGYGSMRLIPYLRKLKPPKRPKLFIGFSDITALHLFFNQEWGWPTLHGRTISQLSIKEGKTADRKELKKIIFGELQEKTFARLTPLNAQAQTMGEITGQIIGGNLRIIQSSLGTQWAIKPRNKFLFIEDVAERGYSVDRMLEQLYQAKLIHKSLKALIIGDFHGGMEKDGTSLVSDALKRFAERVDYPVLAGLPVGHDPKLNFTLPFYTSCRLITGKKSTLTCDFGSTL